MTIFTPGETVIYSYKETFGYHDQRHLTVKVVKVTESRVTIELRVDGEPATKSVKAESLRKF